MRAKSPLPPLDMSEAIDWDIDLPTDPDEEYRALVRALRRTQGFGLLFVRCSPAEGTRLIQRIQTDLPQKTAAVLSFDQPIADGNLYSRVEEYLNHHNHPNILFIQGLEHSIYDYEDTKRHQDNWQSPDLYSYSWKGVPRVLMNLNQQRERFRDTFNTCFVFLIPNFVLSYLVNRAPDFFDWRSGIFQLPMDAERLQQEFQRVYSERYNIEDYEALTPNERRQKILEVQALIDEDHQTLDRRADLYFEQGLLFDTAGRYEEAIAAYDQALAIKPDTHEAFYNKGNALGSLGRYEEAIAAYDQALAIKPDDHAAFNNKGNALGNLGRYEEAIAAFDQILAIKPDYHDALNNKGVALGNLERYEEAIAAYDQALALKPDKHAAFFNKGVALVNLERYEEAIAAFDQALALKPDKHAAFYNKACCYGLQKDVVKAVEFLQQAIGLNPKYREYTKTDSDFDGVRDDERFRAVVDTVST